jgi:hypothetical protein
MDRRDRLRPFPAGAACTACGATVPTSQMRILARRDDVAFVELACRTCGSESLGLLIAGEDPDAAPVFDVTADGPGEGDAAARSAAGPISTAEAAALTDHLRAWDGDLVGWLDAIGRGRPDGPDGWVVDR